MLKYLSRLISMTVVFSLVACLICPVVAHAASATITWIDITEQSTTVSDNEQENRIFEYVPLFNQRDYPNNPYGKYGSIASHGCGITCVAMVATYMNDEYYSVVDLANQFGRYNTVKGSYWTLFSATAKALDINFQEQTTSWKKVVEALENDQVVVSIQGEGLFTNGGHFIVLTGITDDGLITVNDPNGNNWTKNAELRHGFAYGFTPEQITRNGGTYWIYGVKNDTQK